MSKDYRRNSAPARRRDARRGTCAFWFLLGGVVGAFGVGYAWMANEPNAGSEMAEEATTRPPAKPPQERTFDFYSMLPEEEVVVPAEGPVEAPALPPPAAPAPPARKQPSTTGSAANNSAPAAPAKPAASPAPGGSGDYLLQVGSFRSTADAERLKAQLALKGIQTSIQTVTINNGQTYHRVRTATYDKAEARAMGAKLKSEGQDSYMIRAR